MHTFKDFPRQTKRYTYQNKFFRKFPSLNGSFRRYRKERAPPYVVRGTPRPDEAESDVLRQERCRKPDKPDDFVTYEDSDSEEETPAQKHQVLSTSFKFVDHVRSRESDLTEERNVDPSYASQHILTHDMFKETPIALGNINKVFCSQWLSNRQVVFGTKCNKLMVYDVNTRKVDAIPTLPNSRGAGPDTQSGIHACQINSMLGTGARHSADFAIYRLPTIDPLCKPSHSNERNQLRLCPGFDGSRVAQYGDGSDPEDAREQRGQTRLATSGYFSW
ncbi:hypothetical protein quinque_010076 [Culex quinquefasciatus]